MREKHDICVLASLSIDDRVAAKISTRRRRVSSAVARPSSRTKQWSHRRDIDVLIGVVSVSELHVIYISAIAYSGGICLVCLGIFPTLGGWDEVTVPAMAHSQCPGPCTARYTD